MDQLSQQLLNTSVVNTSAIQTEDFEMFLDCLEELCKTKNDGKKRKSKKSKTRSKNARIAQKIDNENGDGAATEQLEESVVNVTCSTVNSANDTMMTVNSEQLNNIFAYFDEDVATDELLMSDSSLDEPVRRVQKSQPNNSERITAEFENFQLNDVKPKNSEIRAKSKTILEKIEQFDRLKPKLEKPIIIKSAMKKTNMQRRDETELNRISSASTLSLHSEHDFMFKKPFDVVDNGNVRRKVVFFSDQSATERSSSESPSTQSYSDDEEHHFQRTQSLRKFRQNRDFFERYFQGKADPKAVSNLQKKSINKSTSSLDTDERSSTSSQYQPCKPNDEIDANEKLQAVQTYVQTKFLLERIQRLVTAISNLDEERLTSMNLKMLKKFLTFIRDCSRNCTEVCNEISDNFLTDFEKNVMSAEDLLFSALKQAQFQQPPENELQKSHDNNITNFSEHQLRVQASLQRLNIPDWFKQYNTAQRTSESGGAYVPGSFTKKRNADVQRWTGLSSKTTSLSSLGSHRSDRSPLMLSPSAQSHHGHTGFSRWSTSHLNSSQTSPSASTRCSFSRGGPNSSILSNQSYVSGNASIRGSFRQPYLGWRSQEKLSQPRTPHERLASSLLSRQQPKQPNDKNSLNAKATNEPAVSPEIQSSIKEVTSAIVHFVNDQNNRTNANSRSRSTSPSSKPCWLESSFVGNKPMDSPQTPVLDKSFTRRESSLGISNPSARVNGVGNLSKNNDTNCWNSQHLKIDAQPLRRHSDGDAPKRPDSATSDNNDSPAQQRRISLDSTESKSATPAISSTNVSIGDMVKCRNPKCEISATTGDAKRNFKCCHNCSQMYCSRDCRRAHWEKHRKACLHSRVSVLCRQVLSTCKDDADTLLHLSILARRGSLTQGRGVVRILFRSPESAEHFVKQGFQRIGEASYVRWPELMPQEMGPELYSELLRLSTEYKPESKMLIYVAICVVSEAPSSTASAVKWERQLVSRCAKLKLSKAIPTELNGSNNNVALHNRTPNETTADAPTTTSSAIEQARLYTDVLILTFSLNDKVQNTQKNRELILLNMQLALKTSGVSLRKHYPEIFQRLNSFVEGTTDRFMPVTLHPRDSATGQQFVCIMMPNLGESDRIKLPESENGNIVTIDCLDINQPILIE